MVKWLKYSLSGVLMVSILFACDQAVELKDRLDESALLAKRKKYYQGSVYRQENSDQLIEIRPDRASYYQGKSIAHTKIGDYHLAIPLLEKAWELNPKETGYYYGWLLLYNYRDYERAIEKLIEYDNFTPNQPDFAWGEHVNYLKGLCYKQLGNYEQAISEFDTLISLEGEFTDVYAYVYRGICKQQLGDFESAMLDFDIAIERYAENSMAYYYKGLSLEKLDQIQESAKHYQKAIDLLERGFRYRNAYHEYFDGISIEMVEDQLIALSQ